LAFVVEFLFKALGACAVCQFLLRRRLRSSRCGGVRALFRGPGF
jgi:hypothetical protein